MKKLLIITGLMFFLAGFTYTYATEIVTNTASAVEQIDDDPTAGTSESTEKSDESTKSSDSEKKSESGEKKACGDKAEKSGCTKK